MHGEEASAEASFWNNDVMLQSQIEVSGTMEVTIERILPGGLGLAHAGGKTVMVGLAAVGDRLRVRIDRVKGNVAFASIEEILEPSPSRVEPPCPYFGRCGGCDFQQMNYRAQLDAKVEIVKDCLHRIAGITNLPEFGIVAAPNAWHYRARAQWQFDAAQKGLGYFESRSRRVCDVAECAVLLPELQWILEDLRGKMALNELGDDVQYFRAIAGDESALVAAGYSRAFKNRGRMPSEMAGSHGAAFPPPQAGAAELQLPDEMAKQTKAWSGGDETDAVTRTIAGESYRVGVESFFQTNVQLLPEMIDGAMGAVGGDTAVELYSGVGLFTLPLARRFRQVIAVEDDEAATQFARQNLAAAGLTNALVLNEDVGHWLEDLECGGKAKRRRRSGSNPQQDPRSSNRHHDNDPIQSAVEAGALQTDLLILDPPRTGAESRVIRGLLKLKPKRIVYVSCDPATLARDLRKIIAGGYLLDSLLAFDMFPQTHHVETVVHLSG